MFDIAQVMASAGNVVKPSNVTINLNMSSVSLVGEAYRLLDEGCIPGVAFRNLDYSEKDTGFDEKLDYNLKMAAFDAQTSGGLLMRVPSDIADKVLYKLHNAGLTSS